MIKITNLKEESKRGAAPLLNISPSLNKGGGYRGRVT